MKLTNIIDDLVPNWNQKEIEKGKNFDDIFNIDGIPIWWFYKRFLLSHVLPKKINQEFEDKNKLSNWIKNELLTVNQFVYRKYLLLNEKIKKKISKKEIVEGNKVLFLSCTNHYDKKTKKIYRIQKIIDKLDQDKKIIPFTIFADPLSKRSYKKIIFLKHSIYGYIDKELEESSQIIAKQFSEKWKITNKEIIFDKKWDLIKLKMNFFFSYEFIYITSLYYLTCKQIIKEEKIKLIVLTSQNSIFDKSFIAAAKVLNIPTIFIQHGIGLGINHPDTFRGMKHAVFGQFYKQRLIDRGIDSNDVIITGPIIFDEIVNLNKQKPIINNTILIISDPSVTQNQISKKEYFEYILKIINSLNGISEKIVLKLHPRDLKKKEYQNLVNKNDIKNVEIIDNAGNDYLYPLINESKLVINFFSTVALEAIIIDKPILSIDLGLYQYNLDEWPNKGGLIIKKNEDLRKAILIAVQDPEEIKEKRKNIVNHFCDNVDGKASERIAKLIYDILKLNNH